MSLLSQALAVLGLASIQFGEPKYIFENVSCLCWREGMPALGGLWNKLTPAQPVAAYLFLQDLHVLSWNMIIISIRIVRSATALAISVVGSGGSR